MDKADHSGQSRPETAATQSNGRDGQNGLNSLDILPQQNSGPSPIRLPAAPEARHYAPIGTAEMLSDETLHLHLRAESSDRKTHGDAEIELHPGDRSYDDVRKHLGKILPGEIKFVSPWLDSQGNITNDKPVKSDTTGGQLILPDIILHEPKAPDTATTPQIDGKTPPTGDTKTPQNTTGDTTVTPPSNQGNKPTTAPATDVVVPPSAAFDASVHKTYDDMTPETRAIITASGATVVATHHLTDAMPELKGQSPRGWPAGATWDAVDGCYSGGKKQIIVAEERQVIGTGKWVASGRTDEVLRHETGHALDYTIKMLSEQDDFKAAYDLDVKAMADPDKKPLEYFLQTGTAGREETVAEGVADREGGATGGKTFHNDFPNTLKVINATIDSVGKAVGKPGALPLPGKTAPTDAGVIKAP